MNTTLAVILTPLLLTPLLSFSSPAASSVPLQSGLVLSDSASWDRLLRRSILTAADSIRQRTKSEIDALRKKSRSATDSTSELLHLSAEILIKEAGDSLNAQYQDTLRIIMRTMDETLAACAIGVRRSADESFLEFQKVMLILERRYSNCEKCENSQDVQSLIEDFRAASDSLAELLLQSVEGLAESIGDSLDIFRDRLTDAGSELIERQAEEKEYLIAHASRVVISGSYLSNVAYRGRDGGLKQFALFPQLAYRHRSGLFVTGSAAWVSNSVGGWDQKNVGGGYEFELGKHFSGMLSYTHFWFSDSSQQEKAELKNSLDGDLSLLTKPVNASIALSLAFSTPSEFTAEFSLSHEFEIDGFLGWGDLSIEPTAAATVGEQNSLLTQKRLKRSATKKGKLATVVQSSTQTTNYFGILDYEFTAPVTFVYGNTVLSSMPSFVVPINVVDASNTEPFVYFSFSASYTIR